MSQGKKGKKSKGKKISLQEFVQAPGGTGVTQVQVPTKLSWADECDEDDDIQSTNTKIIELPTAPRAARLLNDDCVPTVPPFMAYLSNLPYDIEDGDIEDFFRDFVVVNVRLPRDDDAGKSRGYGYVEFETREELIDALSMPDPTIRGRRIKIDLTGESDGRRRNNRYGNDNYGSSDRNNTNWRDRQDGGFSGGRDNVDGGGRRRNDYGRRNNDREPVVVEAGEEGSWRMGDRPKYSPPRERKQFDRPPRDDRDHNNYRDGRDGRDRFGGRRRNDFERPPMQNEELQGERPKLNLKPRTLPMPELTFPKEEEIPSAFKANKQNGDVDHEYDENDEKVKENGEGYNEHPDEKDAEEKSAPKSRGVASAAVFGDAKPIDTAAKEREAEEKLMQRRLELKQKADDDRKRLAESKENDDNNEEGKEGSNDNNHGENSSSDQPKSVEPVRSWRTKDGDNRPRNKNYSPERDNRGHARRQDGGKLRDRNYNRDNRPNDRYGNNRNNRNYNQKDGRPGYRSDRGSDRNNHGPQRQDQPRGERREFNRDSRDIEERMPKYKPVEGANFSVSNTFAGLVVDDQEE